ncbi:DUF951 domain-containing protein [bacterium]|nr:DUF951 domain-containing protein [bacterium]
MPTTVPLQAGMHVELKKPHACGANRWEVIRLGMDIKLRCTQCGRYVTLDRPVCERRVRKVLETT